MAEEKYPENGTILEDRYELRIGRWGAYFHDLKEDRDMDLEEVKSKMHSYELRKKQLRWYVEKYGEQSVAPEGE